MTKRNYFFLLLGLCSLGALLTGCASTEVNKETLEKRTAFAIGREVGQFTISNLEEDKDGLASFSMKKLTYSVLTKDGARYQCFIQEPTGFTKVVSIGMLSGTSEAICSQVGGRGPNKGTGVTQCNPMLKAAGRC